MSMLKRMVAFTFALLCAMPSFAANRLADNEADFYVDNTGPGRIVLKGLTGEDSGADSELLDKAIADLSAKGGGTITINKVPGKDFIYLRGVKLRDKVHLKIAPDVVLRPWYGGDVPRNVIMLDLGGAIRVRDVAVTCLDPDSTNPKDYFTVELTGGYTKRVKLANMISVHNFKVAGIRFRDSQTVYNNVECNPPRSLSRKEGDLPAQGVIKNIVSTGNHVGYGVVQIRAGKRILFANLDGEGGSTLRIESGITLKVQKKDPTIDHLVGRDITCRRGKSAVMISPHRLEQGRVDVSGITSINSYAAVEIGPGFYDKKGGVDNLGTFSKDCYVGGFKKVVGGHGAQVKSKHFYRFPCDEQKRLKSVHPDAPDHEASISTSMSVVEYLSHPDHPTLDGKPRGYYTINLELPDKSAISGKFVAKEPVSYFDEPDYSDCD